MAIATFILRRLGGMAAILLVVSLLVFSLLAMSPGSLVNTLLGDQPQSPEAIAAIEARYHLNDPFVAQYWYWLKAALSGDFGTSIQSGEHVTTVITTQLPVTVQLALFVLVLVVVFGITTGMAAGLRQGTIFDRVVSGATVLGMSVPGFAVGILMIYVFGVRLSWFPVYGAGDGGFASRLTHLTLPAVTLATGLIALIMRQTRAAVLNVMEQDYVTFARARGLSWSRIMVRYALRNTALPVITASGLLLIAAISGAALVESVFSLPGVGSLMVQSVNAKDVPVVQGLAFFLALIVVVVNLLVDIVALVIDPRTRTAAKG
ncbi:ABC transporter permease [Streptomyces sp. NPDC059479]|uniref:ABC transporter permease n=1 Tax=Streptomyces sp. NPDC059479 TaxID=3346848 RepID=UPI0036C1240E